MDPPLPVTAELLSNHIKPFVCWQGHLAVRANLALFPELTVIDEKDVKGERKTRPRLTGEEVFRVARVLDVTADFLLDDEIDTPSPARSEAMAMILKVIAKIGEEEALDRLVQAPKVVSHQPTYGERRKEPPRGNKG